MNTTEAIAEVRSSTKRPDKDTEALSAINQAISTCTMRDNWARDLVEDSITIDGTEYAQVIDISTLTTRFRKWKYLRPTSQRQFLVRADPTQIYSPSGSIQRNRYVQAGDNLTIVLANLDDSLEVGYYQYAPVLTESEGNNEHWMLDLMPYVIINFAKAAIFESIGDDASAKKFNDRYEEQFLIGRRDHVDMAVPQAM